MGDENIYYRHHLRLSGGADSFLGVRDHAGSDWRLENFPDFLVS
jgi:hypothetical protein